LAEIAIYNDSFQTGFPKNTLLYYEVVKNTGINQSLQIQQGYWRNYQTNLGRSIPLEYLYMKQSFIISSF